MTDTDAPTQPAPPAPEPEVEKGTHYVIYLEREVADDYSLYRLGFGAGSSAKAAARSWYRHTTPERRELVGPDSILVAIPTGNHNVLTPTVEDQPRLRL